jgi:hypothetical protein
MDLDRCNEALIIPVQVNRAAVGVEGSAAQHGIDPAIRAHGGVADRAQSIYDRPG